MPKKPRRYVTRTGESEDTQHTHHGDGSRESEGISSKDKFEESIDALAPDMIERFFKKCLRKDGIKNREMAKMHAADNASSAKDAESYYRYVYTELQLWLKAVQPPSEGDEQDNSSSQEEPENSSSQEEDSEVPEEPQSPEVPPDEFRMPTEEDFEQFEDFSRQMLKAIKTKLEQELDRLTVCEARLDEHDGRIETVELGNTGSGNNPDMEKAETLLARIEKLIEQKMTAKFASAPSEFFEVKNKGKVKKVKGLVPKEFKRILQLAQARKNTLLIGPSGCGKTYISPMVAESLDLRFGAMSCSEGGMDESAFQGLILPTGDQGKFEYHYALFVDFYENGGVLLIDEMDNADANLMAFANAALAGDYFYLPKRWNNRLVKRHEDFVCMAAMNTFGHGGNMLYAARNQLDGATLDRFRAGIVEMDYDARVEQKLIDPEVYEWGKWIRKGVNALKMNRLMTTRFMVDCTDMKRDFKWDLPDFELSYYADWEKDDITRLKEWILRELESMKRKLEAKRSKS